MKLSPLHDVDIRLLRIFKVITECQGFAAAEEQLGISRSTISKHISALESRLQMRVCERGRSGFSLTPNGKSVYEVTVKVLDALDEFRAQVASVKGTLSGAVSLWIMDNPHRIGRSPLAHALRAFRKRPGSVHLHLNAAPPRAVEDAVVAGHAHIGLTISKEDRPSLVYKPVATEIAGLYCGSDYFRRAELLQATLRREDLTGHDFVARNYLREDNAIALGMQISTAAVGHIEATLQCILSGCHIGIMPDHIAQPWVQLGMLVRLDCPELETTRDVYAIHRDGALQNPTVKALLDDLANHYHGSM